MSNFNLSKLASNLQCISSMKTQEQQMKKQLEDKIETLFNKIFQAELNNDHEVIKMSSKLLVETKFELNRVTARKQIPGGVL